MTQRADADGNCPHCGAELDIESWPFPDGAAPVVERQPNKCGQCSASTTDICNQNGCGFLESGNGAPVVERQPVVTILQPDPYDERGGAWMSSQDLRRLEALPVGTKLYAAPPELAELQATIDRLTAENEANRNEREVVCANYEELKAENERLARESERVNKSWHGMKRDLDNAKSEIERLKGGQGEPVALAIPDECPHLIMFDDTDRENLLFSGAGARSAALKTWEKISMSWNAHLFVRVERNSRDDRYPSATVSASQPAPVSADVAKAFAKGFNTLETVDGKYKIVMQFAGHDDAWAAYTELSQMTACLDKVKELNQ